MSPTTSRAYAGVSQRHKPCKCGQDHTANCTRRDDENAAGRCRCPRAHGERCSHRARLEGKTTCACPWAFHAEIIRAGKRAQATGSGYASKTAAAKARAEALATLTRAPQAAKRGSTLADHVETWFEARCEGPNALRPKTQYDYRRCIGYIREAVGDVRMRDVDVRTLDEFLRWMRKHHAGAETATAQAFAVLRAAIRWGVRRGLLAVDPTATYDATPKVDSERRESLAPAEFLRVLSWAHKRSDRLGAILWVAVATGLRRGELCALSWLDVDLDAAVLTVRQNAVLVGSQVHVGDAKTDAGQARRVALDAETVAVLRGIQTAQGLEAQAWADDYTHSMLVFTREDGRALSPEMLTKGFPRLIRRYNSERRVHALDSLVDADELARLAKHKGMGGQRLAEIRADVTLDGEPLPVVAWHSLRHLSASIHLAASEGDVFSVSRRLGHANVSTTTRIYGHVIERIQHDRAEAAMRALRGAPTH